MYMTQPQPCNQVSPRAVIVPLTALSQLEFLLCVLDLSFCEVLESWDDVLHRMLPMHFVVSGTDVHGTIAHLLLTHH